MSVLNICEEKRIDEGNDLFSPRLANVSLSAALWHFFFLGKKKKKKNFAHCIQFWANNFRTDK